MDKYNLQQPPNNITFCDTSKGYQREVLRITKDGITANPDVPVDDAAAAVIRALDGYIKNLTQRTWVGLTDEEILAIGQELGLKCKLGGNPNIDFDYARAIEAKLREKNT
jgi:hypothetical protein